MTPQCHTFFTVCLFYALNALLLWTVRRDRNARRAAFVRSDQSGRASLSAVSEVALGAEPIL